MSKNRRRTYGGLAPGEADFTITLARGESDPSKIVSIDGEGMDGFLDRFRRCLMKSTADFHANICYLRDDNSNYFDDGSTADLTGGQGDVMVYFPEFWYKGWTTSSSHKIHISTSEISGYHHAPASLVGAYKSIKILSKLYSYSNYIPSNDLDIEEFIEVSRNRGKGFHLIDYMQHRTISWMFYTRYKNTNSQSICGTGHIPNSYENDDINVGAGSTNSLGITDTTPSNASSSSNMLVNFLGIEGCWGYMHEFIEGIHSHSTNRAVIAYDKPDLTTSLVEIDTMYSELQSNFNLPTLRLLTRFDSSSHSITGLIKDVYGGDYGDTVISESAGTSDNGKYYYCDYGGVRDNTYIFMRSGDKDWSSGISSLSGEHFSYDAGNEISSRLAFDGTIVEKSVSDFKAISSWRK